MEELSPLLNTDKQFTSLFFLTLHGPCVYGSGVRGGEVCHFDFPWEPSSSFYGVTVLRLHSGGLRPEYSPTGKSWRLSKAQGNSSRTTAWEKQEP